MAADHKASEHLAIDFGIVLHSWGTLRRALSGMPKLFFSAVLATALLTFAAWKLQGLYHGLLAGASDTVRELIELSYTLCVDLCDCVVLAAVAVPVHRLVLKDERHDATAPFFGARTLRSAIWLVGFEMAGFVALLPLPLLMDASPLQTAAVAAGMALFLIACFVVAIRLSLVFPEIAADVPSKGRLAASWRLTRHHFWRLFVTLTFALTPLLFAILLATLAASVMADSLSATIGMFNALMWFEVAVTALSHPLTAALGAAVLAWNYRLAQSELAEATG